MSNDIKRRVIITLTTTPRRIGHLLPTLNSLINQTIPVQVWLAVPDECARLGERMGPMPSFIEALQDQGKLMVIETPDFGPATKLVPVWRMIREMQDNVPHAGEVFLIWCDDDIVYPAEMADELTRECPRGAAIGTSGFRMQGIAPVHKHLDEADILEAYAGICCRFKDIPDLSDIWTPKNSDQFEAMSLLEKCHWQADDYILSRALQENGVANVVCNTPLINRKRIGIRAIGMREDGLQKSSATGGNIHAYMRLEKRRQQFQQQQQKAQLCH
jgi:hypothetical protein